MRRFILATVAAMLAIAHPGSAHAQTEAGTRSNGAAPVQGTGGVDIGNPVNVRTVTCTAGHCTEVSAGGGGGGTSGGTATTAAPTYTNNATGQPLSLTLKGGLRVSAEGDDTGLPLRVGGLTIRPSTSFTCVCSAAYAVGDLVANSGTAGSVTPMTFSIGRATGTGGMIRKVRLRKTGTVVTNASFRLHLYSVLPTVTNGDNGIWLSNGAANYVGCFDITVDKAFSDGAAGNGTPCTGSEINFTATTYYGLLEARGSYTGTASETMELMLEVIQN